MRLVLIFSYVLMFSIFFSIFFLCPPWYTFTSTGRRSQSPGGDTPFGISEFALPTWWPGRSISSDADHIRSHISYINVYHIDHEKIKGRDRQSKHGTKNHQDGPLCDIWVLYRHLLGCFFCFFLPWTQRGNQKDEGIRKNLSPRMLN